MRTCIQHYRAADFAQKKMPPIIDIFFDPEYSVTKQYYYGDGKMDVVHSLMRFGLTHQEARLFSCLHGCWQATGYELAKMTGISRSNTYAGLASLVEKGGAYSIDGKPTRYNAVEVSEFCQNVIRQLQQAQRELEKLLPFSEESEDAYLTIKGSRNIRDKIETLICHTHYRIYLSMSEATLRPFLPSLEELAGKGLKVVVITDHPVELAGATVYLSPQQAGHIRLISDSAKALTGEWNEGDHCTSLYSRKENLVELLKDSIKNEIKLIELSGGGAK